MNPITTNRDKQILRSTKFPPEFNQKVDTAKININSIKVWVSDEIEKILGFNDDVVTGMVFDLIENSKYPDIKALQIQVTGFLGDSAPSFCKQLWDLCLSAQKSDKGIPKEFVEARKLQLVEEALARERAEEAALKRREDEDVRRREIDNLRYQERRERGGGGRGHGGGHGSGRQSRDYGRRSRDFSSPPRRRAADDYHPVRSYGRRESDEYRPAPSDGRRRDRHYRERSTSRSRRPSPIRSSPSLRRSASPRDRRRRIPSLSRSRSPDRRHYRRKSPDRRERSRSRIRNPRSERASPEQRRHGRGDDVGTHATTPKGRGNSFSSPEQSGRANAFNAEHVRGYDARDRRGSSHSISTSGASARSPK